MTNRKCGPVIIDVRDGNGLKPPYPWYADPMLIMAEIQKQTCRCGKGCTATKSVGIGS